MIYMLYQVAAAVCVERVPKMSTACSACTCHNCRGLATELLQLRKDVAQVAKLQEDLQKLQATGKTLADVVANLQIQFRVGAGGQADTVEYPPQCRRPIMLDE